MSLLRLNRHPSARQLLVFALAWLLIFGALATAQWRHGRTMWAAGFAGVAVALPLLGLGWREGLRHVLVGLSHVTYPLGLVVSTVVLGGIYYGVLTPIGLLLRLGRYDPLQRRFDRKAATYWQLRADRRDPASYFRQQ